MSGIEIVGIVLGALPLMVSAMEHYEDSRKVVKIWWKIKRTHRRDLGRLKDCELKFRLHLKDLLLPLLLDQTITKTEYDALLASPGSSGWEGEDVKDALSHRLADTYERYVDILQDMQETIAKLAKATMVEDEDFQRALPRSTSPQKGVEQLIISANAYLRTEMKRASYSLTAVRREALINEFETFHATLVQYLQFSDRFADQTSGNTQRSSKKTVKQFKALLTFWQHAERIFLLLRDSWKCRCSAFHCACVLLQEKISDVQLNLLLTYRAKHSDSNAPRDTWKRRPLCVRLREARLCEPARHRIVRFNIPPVVEATQSVFLRQNDIGTIEGFHTDVDVAMLGLCSILGTSEACASSMHLGSLSTKDNLQVYDIHQTRTEFDDASAICLADILGRRCHMSLLRNQRYTLAYILASSLLQFHSTSWITGSWTSRDIWLPLSAPGDEILYRHPYIVASFTSSTLTPLQDSQFTALGIVLLELCFCRLLHEHHMWLGSSTVSSSRPLIEKVIAIEWAKDVQFEADTDYAAAVYWCLSPHATVKSQDWRVEFAQNVLHPLKKCFDCVKQIEIRSGPP